MIPTFKDDDDVIHSNVGAAGRPKKIDQGR